MQMAVMRYKVFGLAAHYPHQSSHNYWRNIAHCIHLALLSLSLPAHAIDANAVDAETPVRYESVGRAAIAPPFDAKARADAWHEARQAALRDILDHPSQETRLISLSNGDAAQQYSQVIRLGEGGWVKAQITAIVPQTDHYEVHLEYTPHTAPPPTHQYRGYGQDFYYAE